MTTKSIVDRIIEAREATIRRYCALPTKLFLGKVHMMALWIWFKESQVNPFVSFEHFLESRFRLFGMDTSYDPSLLGGEPICE